jgi:hypothetical protein
MSKRPQLSEQERQQLREKAEQVMAALRAEAKQGGKYRRRTRFGEVAIDRIEHVTDAEGVDLVEIYAEGATESHFRIYNPPLMTEEPTSDVRARGRRLKHDPIGAIAEVIARHGAAKKVSRR